MVKDSVLSKGLLTLAVVATSYAPVFLFAGDALSMPSSEPSPGKEDATEGKVEFASEVLGLNNKNNIDISRFSTQGYLLRGRYLADIMVNGEKVGSQEIEVKNRQDGSGYVCVTAELLKLIPLAWDKINENTSSFEKDSAGCTDLASRIPDFHLDFDSGELKLNITLPQKFVHRQARGFVSTDLWDSGISAGFLNYGLNSWTSQSRGYDYKSLYTSINSGLNIGAWYFRHNGSYSWTDDGEKKYHSLNSYMQRDIPTMKGRLLVGQSNTSGRVFDTIPFTGIQLASDERMYPASQRGYAPEVHGIARTNAKVTIRQNNVVIYETTVSPGEFVINDLYPTGFGGDLVVTVHEADGKEHYFSVPYAAMPQLLRPGSYRYSFTAGQLRQITLSDKPDFYETTWQHGLTNYLSSYLGWQQSEKYYAAQVGMVFGTIAGSLSLDVTQAHAKFANGNGTYVKGKRNSSGQSYRLSYSKIIPQTGTNLTLATYRFSTDGYYDFTNAMMTRKIISLGYDESRIKRSKSRYSLTAGQSLPGKLGQFYISASTQNYWKSDDVDKQFQIGYSNFWESMSYGVNVNRTYSYYGNSDTSWLLTVSFPLGTSASHIPNVRIETGRNSDSSVSESASLTGILGDDNQYSYGLTARNTNNNIGSSLFVNGQWRTPYTYLDASSSFGRHYESQSLGASGSLLAHSGGITLSPYTSDTWALIEAKGAEGANVSSYPGVTIDGSGFAAVPYLNAYELNEVSIDPQKAINDVGFESTARKVVPYSGAIVKVKYNTQTGLPVLITANWHGQSVPFGADIVDETGNYLATTGQAGQIFVRLAPGRHILKMKAGEQGECKMTINIAENDSATNMKKEVLECQ